MELKGLISFSTGGVIVLLVLWNLMLNANSGFDPSYVLEFAFQNIVFGFIGFMLVGIGLQLMFKHTKVDQ